MNPAQMAQQLRATLAAVTWPATEGNPAAEVFGTRGVRVVAGTPTDKQIPAGFPWALVALTGGEFDADDTTLLTQNFDVICGVDAKGDPMGEHAVIGGPAADLGKSSGRGIAEVAERVRSAVRSLTGADGAPIQLDAATIDAPTLLASGRHIVVDALSLSAVCTSELYYAAPQQLNIEATSWTWEGARLAARFDFKQYRIGHVTGSTPVATPAELEAIDYTGVDPTTNGITAVAGRVYQVFADYSGRKQTGVIEGSSDGRTVGSYAVT